MYTKNAIKFFSNSPDDPRGARSRIAELLGISSGAISQWGEIVPEGQAYKLESLTDRQLQVNPDLYQKTNTTNFSCKHDFKESCVYCAIPETTQPAGVLMDLNGSFPPAMQLPTENDPQ